MYVNLCSFTNYGFYAESTNITSCARPDLLSCAVAYNRNPSNCESEQYGQIDADSFDDVGTFTVDDDIPFIFSANGDGNIALDNIHFKFEWGTSYPITFAANNGTILIVEAVFDSEYDISYDVDHCTVIHNDRLQGDSANISGLLIDCAAFDFGQDFAIQNTMDSASTKYVDHLSATMIWVHPNSTAYYPGLSEKFTYSVGDRIGNVIDGEMVTNITITLSSHSFVSLLWIDANGHCQNCDGVLFNDLSVEQ